MHVIQKVRRGGRVSWQEYLQFFRTFLLASRRFPIGLLRRAAGDDSAVVLADIAAARAALGDTLGSQETFREAIAAARTKPDDPTISDNNWRGGALATIAVAQMKAGDRDGGRQTFALAVRSAQQATGGDEVETTRQRTQGLMYVAEQQISAREGKEALFTLEAALAYAAVDEDEERRSWANVRIAPMLARAGDVPTALKSARRMERGHGLAEALARIAEVQAEWGKKADAQITFSEARKVAAAALEEIERIDKAAGEKDDLGSILFGGLMTGLA